MMLVCSTGHCSCLPFSGTRCLFSSGHSHRLMESLSLEQYSSPSCESVPSAGTLGRVWLEASSVVTTGMELLLATHVESPEMLLSILQGTG